MIANFAKDSTDLGTVKGLAEMAISVRSFFGIKKAPDDIMDLMDTITKRSPRFAMALASSEHDYRREELLQLHSLLHWSDSGMPVFDLTHGLCSALLLTDPSEVDAAEVKLPFKTFVVRLPQPFWEIEGHTGQKWPASYALVHTWLAPDRPVGDYRPIDSFKERLVIRLVSKSPSIDATTHVWEILPPTPESGPLSSWIETEVPDVATQGHLEGRSALETRITVSGDDKHLMVAFRRLLVNLCLYISEKGRGERLIQPRRPSFKKKPAPSVAEAASPDIWVLGREVKLDKELLDSARAWTDAQKGDRDVWKIRSRFTVRGHWRMQAHGVGHSMRRRKWIAPHWRGQGPSLSHIYTTKETT